MAITRHFVDVNGRRVHYRRAGSGPCLLLVHQSPRSSAEYEPLLAEWSRHFTCIAPDTPGFGQSDPLPPESEIDDFADAIIALLDALGIDLTGAYGFHSGGIILMNALRRRPERFTALAVGGYAIWTEKERAHFGERYLPPFQPQPYGEHLTWLWNRVLEQSWFFPWFDVRDETRLSVAHADPARVDAVVRDMLDSGDHYRTGYGAVLRADRDIPPPDARTPPVLITAYDGDPLQAHIGRLGALPAGWRAYPVGTARQHRDESLSHLRACPAPKIGRLPESNGAGFLSIDAAGFDGAIHWIGDRGAQGLLVHGPGRAAALADPRCLRIDLPGHGLSDEWPGEPPSDRASWQAVIRAAADQLGGQAIVCEPMPAGDPALLFPDLAPDRFGAYLLRAWSIVRARHLFDPWYEASASHAVAFEREALGPVRLAAEHRALVRARGARQYLEARRRAGEEDHGHTRRHAAAGAA